MRRGLLKSWHHILRYCYERGLVSQWQQQIEAVAQLPKSQQQFVARMIEMALAQAPR